MLAKTRAFRRRHEMRGRRSRLGARLARPQSIVVYIETETEAPPVGRSDTELERAFTNRCNRFNRSITQSSSFDDQTSMLSLIHPGPFLTRIAPLLSADSLSLFRK
jgi:hypothetical protein